MHRLQLFKVWILLVFVAHTLGNRTIKIETFSKYQVSSSNHHENWHGNTISPLINYEPTIVTTSDFYLKEILKQLTAINKKIDRAMIRLIGSTVKGEDNTGNNNGKARYTNFTMPNCETLINSDMPSGVYNFPMFESTEWIWNIFEIYCEQSFGGGWTVIQRRNESSSSGTVNFTSKCWDDYVNGFGDLNGEFWLGNEWIHRVGSRRDNYRLKIGGYTVGNYTESSSNDSRIFTNYNLKNELIHHDHNCTMNFSGIWWYPNDCIGANLNSDDYKNTKMMIRSKNKIVT